MKNICFSFLMVILVTTARAQFAIEAGANMANMAISAGSANVETGFIVGAAAGVLGDLALTDHIYFQPGIFYQSAGCNVTSTPTGDYKISTLTFPLILEYKTGEKCGGRFIVGIGAYVADNLSGEYTVDAVGARPAISSPLIFGTDQLANLKKLDVGMSANLGYQTRKHFYIRARYQMGFANLYPGSDNNTSIKTSAIGITVGYLFGGCREPRYGGGGGGGSHWRGVKKGKYSGKARNYHKPWLY